jgi:hypothetical protein
MNASGVQEKEMDPDINMTKQSFAEKIIISSENKYKAIFDILVLIFVGYSCVTTLYVVAFNPDIIHGTWSDHFDEFVESVFILDLFLNFIQGYINLETLEEYRGLK